MVVLDSSQSSALNKRCKIGVIQGPPLLFRCTSFKYYRKGFFGMRLLVFGDSHGSSKAMHSLQEKARKADILLCIGDVTVFEQNFRGVMLELDKLGKKVLMIHGNHEGEAAMRKQCANTRHVLFLHKHIYEDSGYAFAGYGGGGFSFTDTAMKEFFSSNKARLEGKKIILMSHAPPFHTTLDNVNGSSCGNKTFRRIIEKLQPMYAFAGHLHENFGKKDLIGKTQVINPGPFGTLVELP